MKKNRIIFTIVLFIAFTGSFLSMLEWDVSIFTSLFAAPFSAHGLQNGFLLIFNRLFYISEQQQMFRYTMFHISSPQVDWVGNTSVAFLFIAVIIGVLSFAISFSRKVLPLMVAFIFSVGIQVYFGVFPSYVWNILLFVVFAFMLVNKQNMAGFRTVLPITLLVGFVLIAVWVIYPGRNERLFELSESIRDRFDTPLAESFVSPPPLIYTDVRFDPEYRDLRVVDTLEDTLNEADLEEFLVDFEDRAEGAEIGFAVPEPSFFGAVLVVVSLLILSAFVRFVPPFWKSRKRRRGFMTQNPDAAINDMFLYLLEWLHEVGLERKNEVFSAYAPRIQVLVSGDYSEGYKRVISIWQKAVYSNYAAGEDERKEMLSFLEETRNCIWNKSDLDFGLRLKIRCLM